MKELSLVRIISCAQNYSRTDTLTEAISLPLLLLLFMQNQVLTAACSYMILSLEEQIVLRVVALSAGVVACFKLRHTMMEDVRLLEEVDRLKPTSLNP